MSSEQRAVNNGECPSVNDCDVNAVGIVVILLFFFFLAAVMHLVEVLFPTRDSEKKEKG